MRCEWRYTTARVAFPRAACAVAAVFVFTYSIQALAVSVIPDPPIPAMPAVVTTDPFSAATGGNIGITLNRNIRQTFQNPTTFNVGQVITAFDVTGGAGGFSISFYTVDDVNATSWSGVGVGASPLRTLNYFNDLPGTTQRLGFTLSGSEVFSLPARNTGSQGYAVVFTNLDGVSNPGQFRHSNVNSTDLDLYAGGRYYDHNGNSTNSNRDLGLWLVAASGGSLAPGDVDGINGVDLADLAIIAANFRTSGGRSEGDLTGNGFIDLFDFRQWKANYPGANTGPGLGGIASIFSIPEPASGSLVLLALLGVSGAYRRSLRQAT